MPALHGVPVVPVQVSTAATAYNGLAIAVIGLKFSRVMDQSSSKHLRVFLWKCQFKRRESKLIGLTL